MNLILFIFLVYISIVNSWLFLLMWSDKQKAQKDSWRIEEKTLWILAVSGGALGGWFGMKLFRHKTKHKSFRFGYPVLTLVQTLVLVYFLNQFYL